MMAQLMNIENPKNAESVVSEGVLICVNCDYTNTTVLTKGVYCPICRSLRIFQFKPPIRPVTNEDYADED